VNYSSIATSRVVWPINYDEFHRRVIVKAPSIACIKEIIERMTRVDDNNNEPSKIEMPVEEMIQMIHKAEYEAYTVLQMAQPSPVPIPKIFGMSENQPSVIVLEDLGDRYFLGWRELKILEFYITAAKILFALMFKFN